MIDCQDVDIPGGTRLMESDTTLPGDKLHDPIETPAGKRESTPVFSTILEPVNGAVSSNAPTHIRLQWVS